MKQNTVLGYITKLYPHPRMRLSYNVVLPATLNAPGIEVNSLVRAKVIPTNEIEFDELSNHFADFFPFLLANLSLSI